MNLMQSLTNKITKQNSLLKLINLKFADSNVSQSILNKKQIKKVSDNLIWLNVVDPEGEKHHIGGQPNETLHETLKRYFIPGQSDRQMCDGGDNEHPSVELGQMEGGSMGVQCFACSVIIPNPFFKQLPVANELELSQVRRNESVVTSNSRLACLIKLEPYMNEMIVHVPMIKGEHQGASDLPDSAFQTIM